MSRSIHTTYAKNIRGLTKLELEEQTKDPHSDLASLAKKSNLKKTERQERKSKKQLLLENKVIVVNQDLIEELKKNVFSDDWELVKSSADRLGQIGGDEVVDFLISLLALDNSSIRNRAALALEDIKDNRALEPLLTAIFKKENLNYNGTMVFALESLDCRQKLKEIFKIFFYQGYEAKMSAHAILSEQIFECTEDDLYDIKNMWDDCLLNPEKCPDFDESKEDIQDMVNSYLSYLKTPSTTKKKTKTTDNANTKKKPSS